METAKDILTKWTTVHDKEVCTHEDVVLGAMKEIADKAWDDGWFNGTGNNSAKARAKFMKELFPESKTEQ